MCRRRRRSSVERMTTVELERPSPTGTATRHAVAARLQALRPGRAAVRSGAVRRPRRRVPVAAPRLYGRDRARRRRALGLRCTRVRDRLAHRRGARGPRSRAAAGVIEGWSAYRDHGPGSSVDGGCDVRLGRVVVGAGAGLRCSRGCRSRSSSWPSTRAGCSTDDPARAIALLLRPPTIWSLERGAPGRAAVPRGRASRPSDSPRSSVACAGSRRARGPAAPRVAGSPPSSLRGAPGRKRHGRRGLRAGRRRRPPARAVAARNSRAMPRARVAARPRTGRDGASTAATVISS